VRTGTAGLHRDYGGRGHCRNYGGRGHCKGNFVIEEPIILLPDHDTDNIVKNMNILFDVDMLTDEVVKIRDRKKLSYNENDIEYIEKYEEEMRKGGEIAKLGESYGMKREYLARSANGDVGVSEEYDYDDDADFDDHDLDEAVDIKHEIQDNNGGGYEGHNIDRDNQLENEFDMDTSPDYHIRGKTKQKRGTAKRGAMQGKSTTRGASVFTAYTQNQLLRLAYTCVTIPMNMAINVEEHIRKDRI